LEHNSIYITRTMDAHDTEWLRARLAERWPGERFTIIHGQVLAPHELFAAMTGPTEYKAQTTTPIPVFGDD